MATATVSSFPPPSPVMIRRTIFAAIAVIWFNTALEAIHIFGHFGWVDDWSFLTNADDHMELPSHAIMWGFILVVLFSLAITGQFIIDLKKICTNKMKGEWFCLIEACTITAGAVISIIYSVSTTKLVAAYLWLTPQLLLNLINQ